MHLERIREIHIDEAISRSQLRNGIITLPVIKFVWKELSDSIFAFKLRLGSFQFYGQLTHSISLSETIFLYDFPLEEFPNHFPFGMRIEKIYDTDVNAIGFVDVLSERASGRPVSLHFW